MKIYLASSWKNSVYLKGIAKILKEFNHEVDCFCDGSTGRYIFSWKELTSEVFDLNEENAESIMKYSKVQKAFAEDKKFLDWCDCCILVLPAGKSSHLEAGYAKGCGKKLIIYQAEFPCGEFDVMYGFADLITDDINILLEFIL